MAAARAGGAFSSLPQQTAHRRPQHLTQPLPRQTAHRRHEHPTQPNQAQAQPSRKRMRNAEPSISPQLPSNPAPPPSFSWSSSSSSSTPSPAAKRHRGSVDASLQKLVDKRRRYVEELKRYMPFRVQYREMRGRAAGGRKPASTPPGDEDVRVWLVGLNVDTQHFTLKRSTGIGVYITYTHRPTPAAGSSSSSSASQSPTVLWHHDATSSSALLTFLAHCATGEISREQLRSFFSSPQSSLAVLVSRFPLQSGLSSLLYTNGYNQHGLLIDLLCRGVRLKMRDGIPKLTKMLRPKRDDTIVIQPDRRLAALASEGAGGGGGVDGKRERGAGRAGEEKKERNGRRGAAAAAYEMKEENGEDSETDAEDDASQALEVQRGSSPSSERDEHDSAYLPPAPTPFSPFQFVIVWWSPEPSSSSSSRRGVQLLMWSLMQQHAEVGVWEMSGEDVDIETVLTRLHVRIFSAMSAPVITAASVQQRIDTVMSHIAAAAGAASSSSSSSPASALPLRLDDACIVIVHRPYFERTVFPLIAQPASVYELTEDSPAIDYDLPEAAEAAAAGQPYGRVKEEKKPEEKKDGQEAVKRADAREEERSLHQSRQLINAYIRRVCAPSPFLLYSLPASSPSPFFPPVNNKCLWSVPHDTQLTRPCVIEWPQHLAFMPAVIMQWCQWQVREGRRRGRQQQQQEEEQEEGGSDVLVIVPCRCWRRRDVREMRQELEEEEAKGRREGRARGGKDGRDGNVVELKGVVLSMRPSPLAFQTRMSISNDAFFFAIHLVVHQPQQADAAGQPAASSSSSLYSSSAGQHHADSASGVPSVQTASRSSLDSLSSPPPLLADDSSQAVLVPAGRTRSRTSAETLSTAVVPYGHKWQPSAQQSRSSLPGRSGAVSSAQRATASSRRRSLQGARRSGGGSPEPTGAWSRRLGVQLARR